MVNSFHPFLLVLSVAQLKMNKNKFESTRRPQNPLGRAPAGDITALEIK